MSAMPNPLGPFDPRSRLRGNGKSGTARRSAGCPGMTQRVACTQVKEVCVMDSIFASTRARLRIVLAALTAALAGCALGPPPAPELQVRERATKRWSALIAGNYDRAYAFLSPAQKAIVAPKPYASRFTGAVTWTGAEVTEVKCTDANRCVASIALTYKPRVPGFPSTPTTTFLNEVWILDSRQWWIVENL